VHCLGILTKPHARVVAEQPQHRGAQVVAQQLDDGGALAELTHRHLGRQKLPVAERLQVLGGDLDRLRSGGEQPLEQAVQRVVRGLLGQLDLDLAEPSGHLTPLDDGDMVVGQLAEPLAGPVEQLDRVTAGAQSGHRLERRVAHVGAHQVDRLTRWLPGRTVEDQLVTDPAADPPRRWAA